MPAALVAGRNAFNALVNAPAGEGDAYGDGAPLYRARAEAVQRRGDAGFYRIGGFPTPDPGAPRYA